MGNVVWTDYVGVAAGVMLCWWILFVSIRMYEQDDQRWENVAHLLPLVSQFWFSVRHPMRAPVTVIVGALGLLIVAAKIYFD